MKYTRILPMATLPMAALLGLTTLSLTGCGGDATTPQPPSPNAPVQSMLAAPAKSGTAVASANAAKSDQAGPNVPVDAKYTIVCTTFAGGGHVQQSRLSKDNLIKATGRRDFYVIHEDQQSTLYYGYYKQIDRSIDPPEALRAEQDMQYLRSLADGSGNKLFPGCLKEAIPVADPDGPPEYDLAKLDHDKAPDDPTRRFWSVAIAAYTVDAVGQGDEYGKNRKQLAVDVVLDARRQGVEAYYFHGPNVSTVCIGAWPRTAVKEQEANDAHSNSDTGQDLVVSSAPLPAGMDQQIQNSGRDIKVVQPRIEIDDPTLTGMQRKYPYYSVNGQVQVNRITDPKTGKAVDRPQPNFLVEIPRLQPSAISGDQTTVDSTPAATIISPLAPSSTGGQLRSVGQ